jgi:hypothetical protein
MTAEEQQAMGLLYTEKYQSEIAAGKMPSIPGLSLPGSQNTSETPTPARTPTLPLPPGAARTYSPQ